MIRSLVEGTKQITRSSSFVSPPPPPGLNNAKADTLHPTIYVQLSHDVDRNIGSYDSNSTFFQNFSNDIPIFYLIGEKFQKVRLNAINLLMHLPRSISDKNNCPKKRTKLQPRLICRQHSTKAIDWILRFRDSFGWEKDKEERREREQEIGRENW